ncbi:MAG: CoA-binding protein [Candidatus Lokiarchaeota archaeon]
MESFFYPNSIVIFGASSNEIKSGNHVLRNILNFRKTNIYLIHPTKEKIYNIDCYKKIFNIPTKIIDLAIIILPVDLVLDALENCIEFGVKSIIVESGALFLRNSQEEQSKARISNIKEQIKLKDIKIMGPNSIGVYNAYKNQPSFVTSLIYFDKLPALKRKNVSIIAQTGLTLSGLLLYHNYIQEFGIAKIASIGNKFDVNESDMLDFLENDPNTDVIALYLEDIKEGKRFLDQCKRIIKKKPIILLKSGKTEKGKKAIMSHTQSLAGDYKIIKSLSKQLGIIIVDDFNEMFQVAKILLNQPFPKGTNIGLISISGAGTVLSSDLSERYHLNLPDLDSNQREELKEIFPNFAWDDIYNPLDIWASVEQVGPEKAYQRAGEILLNKGNLNFLIYYLTAIRETEFNWEILKEFNEKYPETIIIIGFFGGDKRLILQWREILEEKLNIPTFQSISEMFRVISKLESKNIKK